MACGRSVSRWCYWGLTSGLNVIAKKCYQSSRFVSLPIIPVAQWPNIYHRQRDVRAMLLRVERESLDSVTQVT